LVRKGFPRTLELRNFWPAEAGGRYAYEHPEMRLRELARKFKISRGLMHKIARDYRQGQGCYRALVWYGRYPR